MVRTVCRSLSVMTHVAPTMKQQLREGQYVSKPILLKCAERNKVAEKCRVARVGRISTGCPQAANGIKRSRATILGNLLSFPHDPTSCVAVFILTAYRFRQDKDKRSFSAARPIRLDKDGQKWVERRCGKCSRRECRATVHDLDAGYVYERGRPGVDWRCATASAVSHRGLCMSVPVDGAC